MAVSSPASIFSWRLRVRSTNQSPMVGSNAASARSAPLAEVMSVAGDMEKALLTAHGPTPVDRRVSPIQAQFRSSSGASPETALTTSLRHYAEASLLPNRYAHARPSRSPSSDAAASRNDQFDHQRLTPYRRTGGIMEG